MLVFDDCVIDQFSLCGVLLRSVNGLSNDHYLHYLVCWLWQYSEECNIFLNSRFFQLDLQSSSTRISKNENYCYSSSTITKAVAELCATAATIVISTAFQIMTRDENWKNGNSWDTNYIVSSTSKR